jgi:hypothetical protein
MVVGIFFYPARLHGSGKCGPLIICQPDIKIYIDQIDISYIRSIPIDLILIEIGKHSGLEQGGYIEEVHVRNGKCLHSVTA